MSITPRPEGFEVLFQRRIGERGGVKPGAAVFDRDADSTSAGFEGVLDADGLVRGRLLWPWSKALAMASSMASRTAKREPLVVGLARRRGQMSCSIWRRSGAVA
jgi:hypothetical protein